MTMLLLLVLATYAVAGEIISSLSTPLETGSVDVAFAVKKVELGSATLRVYAPGEPMKCDPHAGVVRQLDMKDSFASTPAPTDAWKVDDVGEFRTYTITVTTSRLRQQFAALMTAARGDSVVIGAVTGGSAEATIHACVYGTDTELIEEASIPVVAKSSHDAPNVDVVAVARVPVSRVGRNGYKIILETAAHRIGCADGERSPTLVHVGTQLEGVTIPAEEAPSEGCIDFFPPHPRSVLIRFFFAKTPARSIGCERHVQEFVVFASVDDPETGGIRVALDMVSRFLLTESEMLYAHFIVPLASVIDDEASTRALGRDVAEGSRGASGPVRATVKASDGEDAKLAARDAVTTVMYDGRRSCIVLSIDDAPSTAVVFVTDATMVSCRARSDDGECMDETKYPIVQDGVMISQIVKFAAGKMTRNVGETEICFVPPFGPTETVFEIGWEIQGTTVETTRNEPRHHHEEDELEDIGDLSDLAEWCSEHENCTGIVFVEVPIICDPETEEYDDDLGRCVARLETNWRWAWLPLLFVAFLIIVGIAALVMWSREEHVLQHHHVHY
jgi:hypothetical protein